MPVKVAFLELRRVLVACWKKGSREAKQKRLHVAEWPYRAGGGLARRWLGERVRLAPQASPGQATIILIEKNILGVVQRNT